MTIPSQVYEPGEDSDLLLRNALNSLKETSQNLKICEVGIGSGHVISNIARLHPKLKYFGSDINPHAINYTQKRFNTMDININLKNETLLSGFKKEKFNLILFNTPYLPLEKGEDYGNLDYKEKAVYGGKNGYEIIEEFIYQINDKLENDGFVLMIFSSYSNPKYIFEILDKNEFFYDIVEKEHIFFEDLICLKIWKSDFLKELCEKEVTNLQYFAKGKHSKILQGTYEDSEVVIKIGDFSHIQIETIFLDKLKFEDFVPKLYFFGKNYVVMQKINGDPIYKFLEKANKSQIEKVFSKIVQFTLKLDRMGINKFELTNPYKHIIINENLCVKFIDFERCIYSNKPKNTTQILQYMRKNKNLFQTKGIMLDTKRILEISKRYKVEKFPIRLNDIFLS